MSDFGSNRTVLSSALFRSSPLVDLVHELKPLAQWLSETSVSFRSRPNDLRVVDNAYGALIAAGRGAAAEGDLRSRAIELHGKLEIYINQRKKRDSHLANIKRDSKGLVTDLYKKLTDVLDLHLRPVDVNRINNAIERDTVHARFGILYLLQDTDIRYSTASIIQTVFKSSMAAGNAVLEGFNISSWQAPKPAFLGSSDQIETPLIAELVHSNGSSAGNLISEKLKKQLAADALLSTIENPVSDILRKSRMAQERHSGQSLFKKIVKYIWDQLLAFIKHIPGACADFVVAEMRALVFYIAEKIAGHAIPFLKDSYELVKDIYAVIKETCDTLAQRAQFATFRLKPGYSTTLANVCASLRKWSKLQTPLASAGWHTIGIASSIALPGFGGLLASIGKAITLLCDVAAQMVEARRIRAFLRQAQARFAEEPRESEHAEYKPGTSGGLSNDGDAFAQFFSEACKASPAVAFLILNSGLAGPLFTRIETQNENNTQLISAHVYNEASKWFSELKVFGAEYLRTRIYYFKSFTERDARRKGNAIPSSFQALAANYGASLPS
ncbi:hypothetical protein [Robbsia andropogonis]|uniref:hypothetical protein n=1 Tax=Robbsia andropogonis TaxID=28092 RepID=UPI002A6A8E14|nr:hypothetical protein [Robbsia andropogonis]